MTPQVKAIAALVVLAVGLASWGFWQQSVADTAKDDYLKREGIVQELNHKLRAQQIEGDALRWMVKEQMRKLDEAEARFNNLPGPKPIVEPPRTMAELASDFRTKWNLEAQPKEDGVLIGQTSAPIVHHKLQLADNYPLLLGKYDALAEAFGASKATIKAQEEQLVNYGSQIQTQAEVIQTREAQIGDLNKRIKAQARSEWATRAKWAGAGVLAGFIIAKK